MSHVILNTLLDAVEVAPDNGPLRYYLAETLLHHRRWVYAANEYLAALRLEDVSVERARFGLAQALFYLGKPAEGIELVNSLLGAELTIPASPVHLLHARLLLLAGENSLAVGEYIRAIDGDPSLTDDALAEALGLQLPSADSTELENSSKDDADSSLKRTPTTEEDGNEQQDGKLDDAGVDDIPYNTDPIAESEVASLVDELDSWISNLDDAFLDIDGDLIDGDLIDDVPTAEEPTNEISTDQLDSDSLEED